MRNEAREVESKEEKRGDKERLGDGKGEEWGWGRRDGLGEKRGGG